MLVLCGPVVTGTARLSASGWNLKVEADAKTSDSTNSNRIQSQRGRVIRQWVDMYISHPASHAHRDGECQGTAEYVQR